ncbi:MAG: hypothetical protein AAF637_11845 [Pseudomonadota bacterium]
MNQHEALDMAQAGAGSAALGGHGAARKFVAEYLERWSGLGYAWDDEVVMAPREAGRSTALDALIRPGDEVIDVDPAKLSLEAVLASPWHRRTGAVVVPWSSTEASQTWAALGIACLRADAWLVLDAGEIAGDPPAGGHPAALPGMRRRTITIGTLPGRQLDAIVAPARIVPAIADIYHPWNWFLPVAS